MSDGARLKPPELRNSERCQIRSAGGAWGQGVLKSVSRIGGGPFAYDTIVVAGASKTGIVVEGNRTVGDQDNLEGVANTATCGWTNALARAVNLQHGLISWSPRRLGRCPLACASRTPVASAGLPEASPDNGQANTPSENAAAAVTAASRRSAATCDNLKNLRGIAMCQQHSRDR